MEIPKNCRECDYSDGCWSYYGGSMCKYKDAIYREAKNKMNGKGDAE